MADKVPNNYPLSSYLAEKFARYYEVYVCPYGLSLYNKRTGVYIEHCPVFVDKKEQKEMEE